MSELALKSQHLWQAIENASNEQWIGKTLLDDIKRLQDTHERQEAQLAQLRAQLAEAQQWEALEPYSELHATAEDGKEYVVGVDGDSNVYVLNGEYGGVVLCFGGKYEKAQYRIQRRKEADNG